jgi:molecular chaperone IbpA
MVYKPLTQYPHSLLGFDTMWNDVEKFLSGMDNSKSNYPPHNIIRNGNDYIVEVAAAGFDQNDIDIEVADGYLTIRGEKTKTTYGDKSDMVFVYKGIGTRSFSKTLKIADTIVVRGAEFVNGILRVYMENVIPEHQKPRKILIGGPVGENKPQLLNES